MVQTFARPGRLLALLAVAGALASCQRSSEPEASPAAPSPPREVPAPAAEAPSEKLSWTAESLDGRVRVQQWETGPNGCVVRSSGGKPWSVAKCLGGSMLSYFVSPDGEALLVLDPLPTGVDDAWATATVVTLYVRGEVTKQTNAGALVVDEARLRRFQRRFAWAAGTGGIGGARPDYATATEVAGTTADGRPFRFGFDGSGIPDPVTGPRPRSESRTEPMPVRGESPKTLPAGAPVMQVMDPVEPPPMKEVFSYCTYPERKGSRNFFMCVREPPARANGICSREMSAQYESRVVCSCREDRSGECRDMLR